MDDHESERDLSERGEGSVSSRDSVRSKLIETKARAEAAKKRLSYVQEETLLRQQQEALAGELKILEEKKQIASLQTEAEVLERSLDKVGLNTERQYIPEVPPLEKAQMYVDKLQPVVPEGERFTTEPKEFVRSNIQPDFASYTFKKELLISRLHKFDDNPSYFMLWKATFQSIVKELCLTAYEEVDLLIKYLGPNSAKQALIIHSSNANFPERSLARIWERLEDRYSAPEIVFQSLSKRVEGFPKIVRDFSKLYELSDIVSEIESLKEDRKFASLLAFYDSSAGINIIVNKLPYSSQDRWTNKALSYKKQWGVAYPPFKFFADFMRNESKERNDPGFVYDRRDGKTKESNQKVKVHKTEFDVCVNNSESTYNSPKQESLDCIIHKLPHSLNKCNAFKKMPLSERKHLIFVNRVCFKCCESVTHKANSCKVKVRCQVCNSNGHPTALHDYSQEPVRNDSGEKLSKDDKDSGNCNYVNSKCTDINSPCEFQGISCAKAVLVKVYKKDNPKIALLTYALIDDQSNRSLAGRELFDHFGDCCEEIEYTLSSCSGSQMVSGRVANDFVVESVIDGTQIELNSLIECNDIPNNLREVPSPDLCKKFKHLERLSSVIPLVQKNVHISLLLGRDVPTAHHVLEQIVGQDHEPFAQRLRLGWVVVGEICQGNIHASKYVNANKTYILSNDRPSLFKPCSMTFECKASDCDNLGCSVFARTSNDNKIGQSIEDKRFIQMMELGFSKNEMGNWSAPLPFKENCSSRPLPSNYDAAVKRTKSLCESLRRNPEKCEDFCQFMGEILRNGHAEVAPRLKEEEHWYLPIFGIYHPKKPRKIRVVFDSSAKCKGTSLNDVFLTGPDLTNNLLGVLLRFRKYKVAFAADIQQMFFCFYVKPEDRNFLRFLWFRDNDPKNEIIEYRMCVHVFGNSPSPAIATFGLHKTILDGKEEFGEDTCDYVINNFYVDDGLMSTPSDDSAIDLLKRTQLSLKKGGNLRLHKIVSNSDQVLQAFPAQDLASDLKQMSIGDENLPIQKSLGISWDLISDSFTFSINDDQRPFTRRGLLSVVNGLYDPLGFAAPVTIQGKLFLRNWISGEDWDDPLPESFYAEWENWKMSLKGLSSVHVSRAYGPVDYAHCQLSVFCDASQYAIAASAYVSYVDSGGKVKVSFVLGKAKVAPKSGHTIPRLELCSAVLGVEIAELVCEQLDLDITKVKFYSDSRVVLGYICNETRRFYVYVTNRIDRIRRSTVPSQWHYISTNENPADQGTRGIGVSLLQSSPWLSGPSFLFKDSSMSVESRESSFEMIDPDDHHEVRPIVTVSRSVVDCQSKGHVLGSERFSRFSQWEHLIRALITLKKSINRAHSESKSYFQLKRESELLILKEVQYTHFYQEIQCLLNNQRLSKNSKIRALCPFLDEDGILRVGGRVKKSNLNAIQKSPIIIPGSDHVAKLLILFCHSEVKHQGRLFTEGHIRSKGFWITGVRRLISRIIHSCIVCRKLRGCLGNQKMADLPFDRINCSPPFSHIGLDVFGPWEVVTRKTRGGSANHKRWAVLFTCLSTRAVHIELIEEMTSSSFINALRRFMSVRGPVMSLRSDRGSNFVCGAKELGINCINVEDPEINKVLQNQNIIWKFNTPHSSHKGGIWERMIGIARRILDSMLLNMTPKHLTHEVLSTLMYEVSAIMNSRPLVTVSCDPEDPFVLSPSLLLTQKSSEFDISFVDLPVNLKDSYRAQWKCVQYLADIFWKKWRGEYLHSLQSRQKWVEKQRNIQEGDVILLKDNSVHRNQWPMGLVTKTFQGDDNLVRQVEVKTMRNSKPVYYQRPVTDLILLLEFDHQN